MKIAIAVTEDKKDAQISEQAGRAPYYLFFNEKGEVLESVKNPFAVGGGGAGFSVAKMLADKGIDVFVAEVIGNNMKGALKERNVKYYEKAGVANEVALKVDKDED